MLTVSRAILDPELHRSRVLQLLVQRLRPCCSASLARDFLMQSVVARTQLSRDYFESWLQAANDSKRAQTAALERAAAEDVAAQAADAAARVQMTNEKLLELQTELNTQYRLVEAQRGYEERDAVARQHMQKSLEDLKVKNEAAMRDVAGQLSAAKDELGHARQQIHSIREQNSKQVADAASQMKSLCADVEARVHEVSALKGERDAVCKQLHAAERASRMLEEQLVSKSGHMSLIEKELQDVQQQVHELRADKERLVKKCQEMKFAESGQLQKHAEEAADAKVSYTISSVDAHLCDTFCSISCRYCDSSCLLHLNKANPFFFGASSRFLAWC